MELADGSAPTSGEQSRWHSATLAKSFWLPALISLVVVLLDQATKALVRGWLGPDAATHRYDLAGGAFGFEYVQNSGAAFGILRGQTAFLILAAAAIVAFLILSLRDAGRLSPYMVVGVGLLLGGALGNLTDRVRLGYVTDFIAVGIWPKFNVADSAVTVGLILIGVSYLVVAPPSAPATAESADDEPADQ